MENKYTGLVILMLLCIVACKTKEKETNQYSFDNGYVYLYYNQYNNEKKLIKNNITVTSKNRYGQDNYYKEELYFYDNQGVLVKKEIYYDDKQANKKKLDTIETYSLFFDESISFGESQRDTISYSYTRKDTLGLVIEEYSRNHLLSYTDENNTKIKYDSLGRISHTFISEISENKIITREYKRKIFEDTLFIDIYQDGTLQTKIKEFKDKDTKIEVSIDCESQNIDSTFTTKSKIYSVSYDNTDNSKRIDIWLVDDWGNPTKREHQLLMKIFTEK